MDPASPAIYVACLASYNAGRLHGKWLPLEEYDSETLLRAGIQDMLDASPVENAEEWAIHDTNALPAPLRGEHTDLASFETYAELLERGPVDAIEAYIDCFGDAIPADEWARDFEDRYQGAYDGEEDWAREFLDATGQLADMPDQLARYFDYEAYTRDARLGGDMTFHRSGGDVYAFWNH